MANEQRFEQLKQKYQPAIDLMKQLGVSLTHINMVGDKLLIQGDAPSEEAKNKAWNQIKSIDASYPDLICDLRAGSSQEQKPQTMSAGASVSGGQSGRRYTVQAGDSLSQISKKYYGTANQYMKIFEANRQVLTDPNRIQVGQELLIPD